MLQIGWFLKFKYDKKVISFMFPNICMVSMLLFFSFNQYSRINDS
jgi:hypothetical protein